MQVKEKNYSKQFSQGFALTTNNRMELLAVITALEQITSIGHEVHIHTDSKYVSDAINQKWLQGWVKRAFKNVKNPDLWKRLLPLLEKHKPNFHWIKGHAGHKENEICDRLAVQAAANQNLERDTYFEQMQGQGLF